MEELKAGIDRKTYRLREESLARKRNQEYHKQLFWNDITNYYKTWNVQASKYNVWASQSPTPINHESSQETKIMSLEQRREKLKKLLTEEDLQYAEAMREHVQHQTEGRRESMTKTYGEGEKDNLKSILLGEHRVEAGKVSPQDPWKSVHPMVEMVEKKKSQNSMKMCWTEQMKEKKLREENEKEMLRKLEEESKRRLILEEEKEREFLNQKQNEMKQLRDYLLAQMDEINHEINT